MDVVDFAIQRSVQQQSGIPTLRVSVARDLRSLGRKGRCTWRMMKKREMDAMIAITVII